MKVGGHGFQPWIKYYFEMNWQSTSNSGSSGISPQLLDWRISLEKFSFLSLQLGQWKVDYNRERRDSSGNQQFVERSIVNEVFTIDRQVGAMLYGHVAPGTAFDSRYYAGVFTGSGRGEANDDANMMYFGRYQWNFLGRDLKWSQSDVEFHEQPTGSVAFGAEEVGLWGSFYYVDNMAAEDIERAIVMINFDSLIAGDKLYIHAGFNEKTWARDEMLNLINLRKLPIEIQPGLNPNYPAGLTPDWFSDYTAFNQAGIPIVAFESTNWEIGDYDGWIQTEEYGSFWHNDEQSDNLARIEELFPGRPMVRLNAYTTLVFEFLKHLNP